jgi:HAD superfamily hydrolase (TIGR01509 family)
MNNIKTIFFDFDGVVVDSEPLHAKAKKLVLDKLSIQYGNNIFDQYKGLTDKVFFDGISNSLGVHNHSSKELLDMKNLFFERLLNELKLVDGFMIFNEKIRNKGIKTALVSSTSLYSLKLIDEIYHIVNLFDLVITGADTDKHKPHPDPYLKALKILQVNPNNTVVIEDSPNGIISAKKAGCFVYGIIGSFSSEILIESGADEIVESYKELENIIGV